MRSALLRRLIFALGILATPFASSNAVSPAEVERPVAAEARLGLQMSLITSGTRFYNAPELAVAGDKTQALWTRTRPRDFFTASALLANFSQSDVPFTFPDPVSATRHFKFRVFDSAGTQIWESNADEAAPQVQTTAALRKRSHWKRVVRVPLKIDGQWLAAGRYRLESSVAGEIGATTVFEVVWPPGSGGSGIKGQVLQMPGLYVLLDGSAIGPTVLPHGVPATVTIEEYYDPNAHYIRAPYVWTVSTDEQGRYEAKVPPGRYWVNAKAQGALETAAATQGAGLGDGSAANILSLRPIITVNPGQFTIHDIYLPGKVTYEPPRADTGIRGAVFTDTGLSPDPLGIMPVATQVGLAGARVRITRPRTANSIYLYPFFWEGTTDLNGRFQANTPPGPLRITLARPITASGSNLPAGPFEVVASVDVVVENGKFTDAQLYVPREPAPPSPNAELVASITSVKSSVLGAGGEILRIEANGMVPTGGWTVPQLRARPSSDPATLDLDFVAEPPTGLALQAFMPVEASLQISNLPTLSAIRVHSKTIGAITRIRIVLLNGVQTFAQP